VRKRPNFTHKSGLFLYKKPRKRPVLQAVTSFFAGDVFEDEGFLVFVQGFELCFFVDDGRVDFKRVCGRKFRPQIYRQKVGLVKENRDGQKKRRRNVTVKIERFPEKFSFLLNS
jgi:hypothetical protein